MEPAEIVLRLGGAAAAARTLGQKRTTVAMWVTKGRLPYRHALKVAAALGVDVKEVWPAVVARKTGSQPAEQERAA